MTVSTATRPGRQLSDPARLFALFGLLWSLFGCYQFATTALASAGELVASGFTPAQAALYADAPLWMDTVFALGVGGGTIGSALLLAGRREALPVLAASLAGYVLLFVGDAITGVFAESGVAQVVTLVVVMVIAAALVATARRRA
jgi:hypothetical protein